MNDYAREPSLKQQKGFFLVRMSHFIAFCDYIAY